MQLLWLTWKDHAHPQAGGAEIIGGELRRRLAASGHTITLLTAGYPGVAHEDTHDGYRVIRVGGRFSVYWHAWRYYRQNLRGHFDLIIDEVNTLPFFARFYADAPTILFVHQLAREIWFYQMPFPIALCGYLAEPVYLWLLSASQAIAMSASTKSDLVRFGYDAERISVISEGIHMEPVRDLDAIEKYPKPTLLAYGSVRPMKRTDHILKAFEIAKEKLPHLKLIIAGDADNAYGKKLMQRIEASPHRGDIALVSKTDPQKREELMQRAHVIAAASVREGWGLIITEANSQGTPAVAYNVPGLRDSVRHNETGLLTRENTPQSLADAIVELLTDEKTYEHLRRAAWQWSREITFARCYRDFSRAIEKALTRRI